MAEKIIEIGDKKYMLHNFKDGEINDLVEVFNKKGDKLYEFHMVSNKISGPVTVISGNKKTTMDHLSSSGINGPITIVETDENNHIIKKTSIAHMEDGKISQKVHMEDMENATIFEGNFKKGILNGAFVQMSANKKLQGNFTNGKKDGEFICVKKDQKIITNFENNKLNGKTSIESKHICTTVKMEEGVLKPPLKIVSLVSYLGHTLLSVIKMLGKITLLPFEIIVINNIRYMWRCLTFLWGKIKSIYHKLL